MRSVVATAWLPVLPFLLFNLGFFIIIIPFFFLFHRNSWREEHTTRQLTGRSAIVYTCHYQRITESKSENRIQAHMLSPTPREVKHRREEIVVYGCHVVGALPVTSRRVREMAVTGVCWDYCLGMESATEAASSVQPFRPCCLSEITSTNVFEVYKCLLIIEQFSGWSGRKYRLILYFF